MSRGQGERKGQIDVRKDLGGLQGNVQGGMEISGRVQGQKRPELAMSAVDRLTMYKHEKRQKETRFTKVD
jgi:hypothetical protein